MYSKRFICSMRNGSKTLKRIKILQQRIQVSTDTVAVRMKMTKSIETNSMSYSQHTTSKKMRDFLPQIHQTQWTQQCELLRFMLLFLRTRLQDRLTCSNHCFNLLQIFY